MSETMGVGSELGGYRLTAVLGRGGMGNVYEAEHTILGRKAAIKTLLPELAGNSAFRERFIRESQMAAALDHPGIIPIYDAGETNGVVYIAMRHVGGGDLQELIGAGPVELDRAIWILEQVAGALDAAHARGLVHRDVKPANVLVDGERVYLTDFGIAKQAGIPGLTQTGFFVGTLDYAAPEQIQGKPVGPQADVYAFGCLLFEILTGEKPFARETDVAVMHAHLLDPPPSAAELRPELPGALDEVIARALEKDATKRIASCRDVMEAVRACLGVQPVALSTRADPSPTSTAAAIATFSGAHSPLIGRDAQLAAVVELVRDPVARLVTLTGPSGIGKTRLALAAAGGLESDFARAWFVDLASIEDEGIAGSAIAAAVEVEETTDLPLAQALAREIGSEPGLLILDNFERLLPATSLVQHLVSAASELTVLVTSQAALQLHEEQEFQVPPLSLSDPKGATTLAGSSAVEFFVDRAQAAISGFKLTAENGAAVAGICRRLGGLPLAIELAAARIKLLSPQAILAGIENRRAPTTGGADDLPSAAQRTLNEAIDWSHELLEPSEQALLARLGVFAGGCSLELADAVCGDELDLGEVFEGLASLVDKSLVRQLDTDDGEPRFDLLEAIREYALERLQATGELEGLRRKHAERYLELVEAAEPELAGANQALWVHRLDEESDNIRAALSWTVGAGEVELGLRLADALAPFWRLRRLRAEGRRWRAAVLAVDGARTSPSEEPMAELDAAPSANVSVQRSATTVAAAAPTPRTRDVRKKVTVVLCDVGSADGRRLDPELLRWIIPRLSTKIADTIERHGGSTGEPRGSSVLAVFGIPGLHEDDALRAVRAAVDAREALVELGRSIERESGVAVGVRITVSTGEVVASDDLDRPPDFGEAAEVFAGLETFTKPGEITISEETYRLVKDIVSVEPGAPGGFRLRGFTFSAGRGLDSPIVGRERQRPQGAADRNERKGDSVSSAAVAAELDAAPGLKPVELAARRERWWTPWRIVLAVAGLVALAGGSFLATRELLGPTAAPPEELVRAGGISFIVPSGWHRAPAPTRAYGMTLSSSLRLETADARAPASLTAGWIDSTSASLLTPAAASSLTTAPASRRIARLGSLLAYSYQGSERNLVAFFVRTTSPEQTLSIVCENALRGAESLRGCESIAATVRLSGVKPLPPTTSVAYATEVESALQSLAKTRDTKLQRMRSASTLKEQAAAAGAIAEAYVAGASAVGMAPTGGDRRLVAASAGIVDSLRVAEAAYRRLEEAAARSEPTLFQQAASAAMAADAKVRSRVAAVARLGYRVRA